MRFLVGISDLIELSCVPQPSALEGEGGSFPQPLLRNVHNPQAFSGSIVCIYLGLLRKVVGALRELFPWG